MWKKMNVLEKGMAINAGVLLLVLFSLLVFRVGWVNYIDNYELGYKFDRRTGEISVLPRTGYWITPPVLVKLHTVDLRPMQTCISSNQRVLNCKLVQFNRDGLDLFLSWHGRGNYNALTLNPILQAYAYEGAGKNYPFLSVLRDMKTEDVSFPRQAEGDVQPNPTLPLEPGPLLGPQP